jgi:cell division protein FtsB
MYWFYIVFILISISLVVFSFYKYKKSKKSVIRLRSKTTEKEIANKQLAQQNEFLEAELKLVKQIYRNKLIKGGSEAEDTLQD